MEEAVILSAARIPIGKFGGALAEFSATKLGAFAIKEAVRRSGIEPKEIQEVIMGNVVGAGLGQNPARQATLYADLPNFVNATTINKVCGSGLKAVALLAQAIRAGDLSIGVGGGMESMSNAPYLLDKARWGYRLNHGKLVDSAIQDGLWDIYNDFHMGMTAELVSERYSITRKEQDEFAVESHKKAILAIKEGKFNEEIVPVLIPVKKGEPKPFNIDESPREDSTLETLSRLKPAFKDGGTVTAGNAPGLNDGASAVVVAGATKARELGVPPIARILGYTQAALDPKWVMIAPIDAVKKLLENLKLTVLDFDLIELNEAFSVQALAVMKELKLKPEKVNVHGGAVALGHPIGASGARILTTLIYALKSRGKKLGLTSLCLGGGGAVAMAIEML